MAEPATAEEIIADEFSRDDVAMLQKAIKQLEKAIFTSVIKRCAILAGVVGLLLTGFGILSFRNVKEMLIDEAAAKLANDAPLRHDVANGAVAQMRSVDDVVVAIDDAKRKLAQVQTILNDAQSLRDEIDSEQRRAINAVNADLSDILRMTEQVRRELAPTAPPQSLTPSAPPQ